MQAAGTRASASASILHRYAGLALAFNRPVAGLPMVLENGIDPAVHVETITDFQSLIACQFGMQCVRPSDGGAAGLTVGYRDGEYGLMFDDVAAMVYAPEHLQLTAALFPSRSEESLDHLLLDQAIPRVLGHAGHLMLHASAVAIEGGALLFVGASGAGKSTMAAALVKAGFTLLADDVVRVEARAGGVRVHPGYPSLRLWGDSASLVSADHRSAGAAMADYSEKRVFMRDFPGSATGGLPVLKLWLLEPNEGHEQTESLAIAPSSAVLRLMAQSFVLHPGFSRVDRNRLASASALVSRIAVERLVFRHDFGRIDELAQCVEELARRAIVHA